MDIKQKLEAELLFLKSRTEVYLGIIAMMVASTGCNADLDDGYSRGDYKRAVRFLRAYQNANPNYSDDAESAIALIRREWLHREKV